MERETADNLPQFRVPVTPNPHCANVIEDKESRVDFDFVKDSMSFSVKKETSLQDNMASERERNKKVRKGLWPPLKITPYILAGVKSSALLAIAEGKSWFAEVVIT